MTRSTLSKQPPGIPLDDLPPEHALRNLPLREIGAFYLVRGGLAWREVFPNFGIAKKTYNQLSAVWTTHDRWIATKPDAAWDEARIDIIGQNGNDGLHYQQ